MDDEERRRKHREYMRKWARKHPRYMHERRMELQRQRRANNPERTAIESERTRQRLARMYAADPEPFKARARAFRQTERGREYSKNYQREWHRRRKARRHGVTDEQYRDLASRMDGPCEICGSMESMHIDHDHTTNVFRGLLCRHCNYVLGFARDRIDVLRKAIEYLKVHGITEK